MNADTKRILTTLKRECKDGKHLAAIQDLAYEIQFRLGCSWGAAITHADSIKVTLATHDTHDAAHDNSRGRARR